MLCRSTLTHSHTDDDMTDSDDRTTSLSYNAALVLQALTLGHRYGFDVMGVTSLPSGTVYPLLRRLEAAGMARSRWEDEEIAHNEGRPARRYYEVTAEGERALAGARERIVAQQAAVFGDLAPSSAARSGE